MLIKKVIFASIASLGLLFGVAANQAVAADNPEITQFQPIEQPLWVKGAVTAGGLALIGLEIWWFLGSKPKEFKK
ncbi:hypothetical protein [Microseira sp. BLCC-F43]|jgi:plastocyanin domain-containing protein|uniref:hypothetical protein n=1 Tax=Microseira sp. BLCC-F43 TaxID=3153602 RepID=UPI0035B89B8E